MKTPLPPDPENQNDSRAHDARQALRLFANLTGITGESPHTQLQDLLTNLRHMADRTEGLDFDDALLMAQEHYEAETAAEDLYDEAEILAILNNR